MGHNLTYMWQLFGGKKIYFCTSCRKYFYDENFVGQCDRRARIATLDDYSTDIKNDEEGDQGDYEPL